MVRSGLFRHLFLSFSLLIVCSVALLAYVVTGQTRRAEMQTLEERLTSESLLVAHFLRKEDPAGPEAVKMLRELPRAAQTRVTLLAVDGRVLADSPPDPDPVDNEADGPEVKQALANGRGQAVRPTALGEETLYVAVRAQGSTGTPYVVRSAVSLEPFHARVRFLQRLVITATTLTGLVGLGLVYWLAGRSVRPLHELVRGAEQIAAGAYGHRVYADGSSEVDLLARTFNHMSQRLAAQFAQIDEDRQQLRTVLSSMVEGVIAIDPDQRILFANDRAGELLDFAPRAAVGRRLWELVRQRALQEIIQRALVPLVPDARPDQTVTLNLAGGRSFLVHVARLPGLPNRGAVLVFHDNTELRRLERLRQEFVANVSHELKTPLAVIVACVETLLEGGADDVAIREPFLRRIAEQGERLHRLILDLLRLARIESETEVFSREELELGGFVEQCLERQRAVAEKRGQTLVAVPPADHRPVSLWIDVEAAEQILDNLVDNALKYTPEAGRIEVRWAQVGGQVILEVQDTGIGIPESELPRIFERFYRVDKARSRELGGTGLGLSIVKHLVQAMQGTVEAKSREGQGTTFTIRFPALVSEASPALS